jgi:hypothetical protein
VFPSGSGSSPSYRRNPEPILIELILGAGKKYRLLDYPIFLFWWAWVGQTPRFIPLRHLQDQFDKEDGNPWCWPENFKGTPGADQPGPG